MLAISTNTARLNDPSWALWLTFCVLGKLFLVSTSTYYLTSFSQGGFNKSRPDPNLVNAPTEVETVGSPQSLPHPRYQWHHFVADYTWRNFQRGIDMPLQPVWNN